MARPRINRTIRFDWVPIIGAVLTIFGVIGFAAGRTYLSRYWNEYGVGYLQFDYPVTNVVLRRPYSALG